MSHMAARVEHAGYSSGSFFSLQDSSKNSTALDMLFGPGDSMTLGHMPWRSHVKTAFCRTLGHEELCDREAAGMFTWGPFSE